MGAGELTIEAEIDGRMVSREEVKAWEMRRMRKVCRKLGIGAPSEDPDAIRNSLVARKLELGHEALEKLLARDLRLSELGGRMVQGLSRGRTRLCGIELSGSGGSAEAMPGFYRRAMENGDEANLLAACPDHYILCKAEGLEQVVETVGGSPLAGRIVLDESDVSTVRTDADPTFPVQWVAVGRYRDDGPAAGAIRHQFRDEPGGFTVRLTGEFPLMTPPPVIREHKWHLACEFSNWIEAANRGG